MFRAIALTLFPEMFPGPLGHSLAGKALEGGLWSLETVNIRDFAADRHATVDEKPYGGGTGMVLKADVIEKSVLYAKEKLPDAPVIYFTPRGRPLTQGDALAGAQTGAILLCGRFEGVDQRVIEHFSMLELSLGDFILSGGEIPAYAYLDACVRLLPGVIGKESALAEESFNPGNSHDFAGLLEYPHYTRPPHWNGHAVPEVLLSGHHEEIKRWRLRQAQDATRTRRPDMWERYLSGGNPRKLNEKD